MNIALTKDEVNEGVSAESVCVHVSWPTRVIVVQGECVATCTTLLPEFLGFDG